MIELTTPEIVEIWEKSEHIHDLIRLSFKLGCERGRLSHMRETDLGLNALLHILEGQDEKKDV